MSCKFHLVKPIMQHERNTIKLINSDDYIWKQNNGVSFYNGRYIVWTGNMILN